jgi:hypothetical protein
MPGKHGGRRPGAGAPLGNLNGLKTGVYSARLRNVLAFYRRWPQYCRPGLLELGAIDDAGRITNPRAFVEYIYFEFLWTEELGYFVPLGYTRQDLRDEFGWDPPPWHRPP